MQTAWTQKDTPVETETVDLTVTGQGDYQFLDSGDGRRLEQFGPYKLIRPSPVAIWPVECPELWSNVDGLHARGHGGEGRWTFNRPLPPQWMIDWQGFRMEIKPTGFGHTGLFPEHAVHRPWLTHRIQAAPQDQPPRILHLFAYTGAMTLATAGAGAEVCHVDAVADIIAWARRNAAASALADRPIRWITDDVMKFTAREIRRGRRYDGIILDPPSYGKGPGGERWILEEHLVPLLARLPDLLSEQPRFVLFTCHSTGFSPALMHNLMNDLTFRLGGQLQSGSMLLGHPRLRRRLPCGFYTRWRPSESQNV